MNIAIKGLNMDLTEGIKTHIDEKLEHVKKLVAGFDPVADIQVEVGKTTNHHKNGMIFRCELNLRVPGGELRAEEEREDLYEAIDLSMDELRRQLVDRKERLLERHHGTRPGKE